MLARSHNVTPILSTEFRQLGLWITDAGGVSKDEGNKLEPRLDGARERTHERRARRDRHCMLAGLAPRPPQRLPLPLEGWWASRSHRCRFVGVGVGVALVGDVIERGRRETNISRKQSKLLARFIGHASSRTVSSVTRRYAFDGLVATCYESVDACPSRDSCPGPGRRRALSLPITSTRVEYSRGAVTLY
jgi:hypothetical protein